MGKKGRESGERVGDSGEERERVELKYIQYKEHVIILLAILSIPHSISDQRISSVAVNSTGEWLAFGCKGLGQLLVWEWQSETYVLKQQGHFYDMNALAYSPDGQLVATGGDDCKVIGAGLYSIYIHA